jgi:antirestriction protein
MTMSPKIYVACLAAYNNGKLHGEWIDCTLGIEHIRSEIKKILASSPENLNPYPCEEWAIHDFEDFGVDLSEWEDLEKVAALGEFLSSADDSELAAEVLAHANGDIEEAQKILEEYVGEYKSRSDFAYELAEDCGDLNNIPQWLQYHIDWDNVARDLFLCDYMEIEMSGKLHVFRSI